MLKTNHTTKHTIIDVKLICNNIRSWIYHQVNWTSNVAVFQIHFAIVRLFESLCFSVVSHFGLGDNILVPIVPVVDSGK